MAMAFHQFKNRSEAGKVLAAALSEYAEKPDLLVLALPRGGVPVAHEVAKVLQAPLDLWLVRKLGVPGHEELAMGALAAKNFYILNDDIIHSLQIKNEAIQDVIAREKVELERRNELYRQGRPPSDVKGKIALVVDDGLATGATMKAAIESLRKAGAARIVTAVPVGSRLTCNELEKHADDVVCPFTPEPFYGVGAWYDDFSQVSDREVQIFLASREAHILVDNPEQKTIEALKKHIHPWTRTKESDYDSIIEAASNKKFVLIGEATHGTADFYRIRAEITQRLITEKGFDAVAVEADWPDAYRVNRYVSRRSDDATADQALSDFERFPAWMWRNTEVAGFVEWLYHYNGSSRKKDKSPIGFYGLDLYSMTASIKAVLSYLEKIDPEEANAARKRYACFGQFINDPQAYGYAMASGVWDSCEKEVIAQLIELQRKARLYVERDGIFAGDKYFSAEQNAELVKNAEQYYRALYRGRPNTWNIRDRHMFETLEKLAGHLEKRLNRKARIVVWAHNSHLGNAAATDMQKRDEINIGQLVSEKYRNDSLRIGFSTSKGTVTAASDWDEPAETKAVRPPLSGSYEDIFSRLKEPAFLIDLRDENEAIQQLRHKRLQRAIGVIYRPETERLSHYFYADLPEQFDFMIHINETRALEPLSVHMQPHPGEMDETYPYGL